MLMGALSGVEMGLRVAGVPHRPGGVAAALALLADASRTSLPAATPAPAEPVA
jgi:alanine-glyoxylate transaminase/serine-glyoxylate transaminase/serine-pyruvate transaminase